MCICVYIYVYIYINWDLTQWNCNLKIPSFPEYIIWILCNELNLSLDIYILYEILLFYHIAKARRKMIKTS